MRKLKFFLALAIIFSFFQTSEAHATTNKSINFQAEVWADNWFELFINGKKIGQDSVPLSTEKSFNSEKIKFSATYPLTVGVVAKDFTENSTGLEYIGKANQQIGDGGFILQIKEVSTGKIVAYTSNKWKVLTINVAPLNESCEKSTNPSVACQHKDVAIPKNWSTYSFKDSAWKFATAYTKEAVGVKEGYFDFNWNSNASLVWSNNLKLDNTILLRTIVKSATSSNSAQKVASSDKFSVSVPGAKNQGTLPKANTCDGVGLSPEITWLSPPQGSKFLAIIMDSVPGPSRPGESANENHFYLLNYNIPNSNNSIPEGNKSIGVLGQNFIGRNLGYTPPCSQGPGSKIYTITLYALSEKLDLLASEATEKTLLEAMNGKVIQTAKIDLNYQRDS